MTGFPVCCRVSSWDPDFSLFAHQGCFGWDFFSFWISQWLVGHQLFTLLDVACPFLDVQKRRPNASKCIEGLCPWVVRKQRQEDGRQVHVQYSFQVPEKVTSLPCAGACDARKGAEKRLRQEKNDKNRIQVNSFWWNVGSWKLGSVEVIWLNFWHWHSQVNLERCTLCMESLKLGGLDVE